MGEDYKQNGIVSGWAKAHPAITTMKSPHRSRRVYGGIKPALPADKRRRSGALPVADWSGFLHSGILFSGKL